MIQDKTQSAGNGEFLSKDCNAVLDHLGRSLRASREALAHGVAALGKDPPFPASRAWWSNASRLAEYGNITLKDY